MYVHVVSKDVCMCMWWRAVELYLQEMHGEQEHVRRLDNTNTILDNLTT